MIKIDQRKRIEAAEARTRQNDEPEYDFSALQRRELLIGRWLVKRGGDTTFDDVEINVTDQVERRAFQLIRSKAKTHGGGLSQREQAELESALQVLQQREMARVRAEHPGEPAYQWQGRVFSS